MKKKFYCLLILFISLKSNAKTDSLYIDPYENRFILRPYLSMNMMFLTQETENGKDINYMPNVAPSVGLGFSIHNTIISFSLGIPFDFMIDKKYGKTKSFDFQLHNYGRNIVWDLYIQQYKGFYDNESSKAIELYPDLEVEQYGLYGQYVFNNKRFSYKAAFYQSEVQLRPAGSFLLGGGIYTTKIRSDGSFLHKGKNSLDNFQFGISAGYAYTWVPGKYWYISASATTGINFGSEKFNNFGKKLEVYPTVFPRLSTGYNRDSWSWGFTFTGNMVFQDVSENTTIGIMSMGYQIYYIKRFDSLRK